MCVIVEELLQAALRYKTLCVKTQPKGATIYKVWIAIRFDHGIQCFKILATRILLQRREVNAPLSLRTLWLSKYINV